MGLVTAILNTEVSNATYFDLADTTGDYNSVTNTTGWGGANTPTTAVTSIVIAVILPGGTLTTYFTFVVASGTISSLTRTNTDGTSTVMTPFSPTTFDNSFVFRLYATYFGLTSFEDGFYTISYTVSGTYLTVSFTHIATHDGSSFFVANLICCKNTKLSKAAIKGGCGCVDSAKLLNLDLYIKGIISSANCGKINAANQSLTLAQNICNDEGCSSC